MSTTITNNSMSYVKRETVMKKRDKAQKNKGKRGTSQKDQFFDAFDNLKPDNDKGLSIPVKGKTQKEMEKHIRNHRALAYQYNREVLDNENYKIKTVSDKDSGRMYFVAVEEEEDQEQAA